MAPSRVLACLVMLTSALGQSNLFVSPKGNDATGDGSAANPFATPGRAFTAVGDYKATHSGECPPGGFTVNLAGGGAAYYQSQRP